MSLNTSGDNVSNELLPGYKMSNNDLQHIENPWYPNMHELSYHKHFLERGTPCPLLKLWFIVSSTFTFLQGIHIDQQADAAGKNACFALGILKLFAVCQVVLP